MACLWNSTVLGRQREPRSAAAPRPAAWAKMSTAFLRKFENRISVTNRDGSITKVGEPAASVGLACNSPGKSHLHPALVATGLTGHSGGSAWPVLTETTQPAAQVMQAAQLPSPQRKVRGKPTAAELEVRSLTHPAAPTTRWGCRRRAAPHGPVRARVARRADRLCPCLAGTRHAGESPLRLRCAVFGTRFSCCCCYCCFGSAAACATAHHTRPGG